MKIFVDIGHPAHVHYFKNFIRIMRKNGHHFFVSARDKEVTFDLLEKYGIKYFSRGKGVKRLAEKPLYMVKADFLLYKQALRFRPDLFLSFGSPYAAHVSTMQGKVHIAFDDTEHARFEHLLYRPFTNTILTPASYLKNISKKQVKFDGYMELSYLHPNYFSPNPSILDILGTRKNDKNIILRFVSWGASHDVGHRGLSLEIKLRAVKEFSDYARVFISSEGELPKDLKQYQIKIPPDKMHDALAFATLFIGEGATMASECAMLGVPTIYVNSLTAGTLEEQEKYGLIFSYRNSDGIIEKAVELLRRPNLRDEWETRRQRMLSDKIDVTAFMVWFIENYPESAKTMKKNPDYQLKFK